MPDEQAEPDDTATPSRSKAMTAVSAFRPGTANRVVLGSRSALRAEDHDLGRRRPEARFEPVAQRRHARASAASSRARRRGRRAEAGNAGHILGSRPQPALLPAAPDQRLGDMDVAAPDQRADALADRRSCARRCVIRSAPSVVDITRDSARPPAPRRHAARRPPHARCRRPARPAERRRSRCWRA